VRRMRLLHIEDCKEDHEQVGQELSRLTPGLDLDLASCASDALGALEQCHYDCILSEFKLSGMSGLELLKIIRSGGDSTPFIFLTDHGSESVAAEAFHAGADDYFTKEHDPSQYKLLLNSILRVVKAR
jgi:DNA-binding response OmpR family regulator